MIPEAIYPLEVAIWLGVAYITARIAQGRGRMFLVWAILGLAFPPVALICALCLSKEAPGFDAKDPLTTLSLNTPTAKPQSGRKAS